MPNLAESKITEQTTLSELQLEAGKNGITLITAKLEDGFVRAGLQFSDRGVGRFAVGTGEQLHDAINNAFENQRQYLTKSFEAGRQQP